MPDRDLDHSRLLDVHRWSDYPEVDEWVDKFWHQYLTEYFPDTDGVGRKPKQTPRNMFKVLFLDLYVAWLDDPALCLGVSRTASHYVTGSRYNALHISDKLITVMDALLEKRFIEQHKGSEIAGRVTRIWPTDCLITYFKKAAFSEFMIGTYEGRETVILNSKEVRAEEDFENSVQLKVAKPIEYDDEDDARILPTRELLRRYNQLLANTHIDLGCQQKPEVVGEQYNRATRGYETRTVSLSQRNKFVRRVFYRGDWNLGGRYHGGWWQQIGGGLRRHILINGERTYEVDFSGFHVALAYAQEGRFPPKDSYTLPEVTAGFSKEKQRDDVKLLVLTALNADSEKAAFKAFRDQRNKDQRATEPDQKIRYTDALLKGWLEQYMELHRDIRSYLCSDKGVELMALDGNITTRIIKHFTDRHEPILTVHDSYIVRFGQEEEVSKAMLEAVKQEVRMEGFGLKRPLQGEIRRIETFQAMDSLWNHRADYQLLSKPLKITEGYKARLERFTRFRQEYPV
jgi:hypothetical protein